MKIGDEATLLIPGSKDPVDAKVTLISPALDPGSTTVEVWIKVDNKAGTLKVGTPVKVAITGETVAEAWKISGSAVLTAEDGSKSVMVIGSDGAAHRTPFGHLARQERGSGGEIQLTDALERLIEDGQLFHGLRFEGKRFDCGDKLGFLEATIALGLEHPDLGPGLRRILASYL